MLANLGPVQHFLHSSIQTYLLGFWHCTPSLGFMVQSVTHGAPDTPALWKRKLHLAVPSSTHTHPLVALEILKLVKLIVSRPATIPIHSTVTGTLCGTMRMGAFQLEGRPCLGKKSNIPARLLHSSLTILITTRIGRYNSSPGQSKLPDDCEHCSKVEEC